MITSCDGWIKIPFQETLIDFDTVASTYLYMECLMELHRELISVGKNTFLINGECYIFGLL
jgi:hypothetical protein